MRLLSLDLERYGPFTGRRLAFRPEARLHVVLGPNEAGKSSALAAVTDLLFGIEERTRWDFLHREEGLRLGAEIRGRDGQDLAFFRRKGRKNLLSDPSGGALPDDALAPFLGGLTRPVFCNAFGLDAARLREGAEEMLKSDGELGRTLFAAASGLRGVRDLARSLDEEAAAIHTPRGRERTLTLAIGRFNDAKREMGQERIGQDAWRRLGAEIAAAEERLAEIGERRRAIGRESATLRRLKAAAPILRDLDDRRAAEAAFEGLVEMDDAAIADLARLHREAESAAESRRKAETALAEAEAALAAVRLDPAVAPHEAAIRSLQADLGKYRQSVEQLPRVRAEADVFTDDLARIATRLGLPDAQAVEAHQPTDMALRRLEGLVAEGREIEAESGRLARERARLDRTLADLRKAAEETGPLPDLAAHRQSLAALDPVLAEIPRRDAWEAETAREERALAAALQRLVPALPGDIAALALPSAETIRRFAQVLEIAARARDRARERLVSARDDLAAIEARMSARAEAGDLPDPASLAALRRDRGALWTALRGALLGEAEAPSGSTLLGAIADHERLTAEADRLADRLAADAALAAEHASDSRRRDGSRRALGEVEAAHAEAVAALAEAEAEWAMLWAPLGIAPLPPAEMALWRADAEALAQRQAALETKRVDLAGLKDRIEGLRPALAALAERLGLAPLVGLDVALGANQVRERLRQLDESWEAARDRLASLRAAEDALATLRNAQEGLSERSDAWRDAWGEALAALGLPPGTGLAEADAAHKAWGEVPTLLRERGNRLRRVSGIRRDIDAYEEEARAVRQALGLADDLPAVDAARALQQRVEAARAAAIQHEAREAGRASAAVSRVAAVEAHEGATKGLETLTSRFAIPAGTDLSALGRQLAERSAIRSDLRRLGQELARAAEGAAEAELRAQLAEQDRDALAARLVELDEEREGLERDSQHAFAEKCAKEAERTRLEGGRGAEDAAARKAGAEVEIREAARRYAVLRLGSLLLDAAVDRHRAGRQDPLLTRAGALFARLTGGAFSGLDQGFDEKDQAVIQGVRAAGGRTLGQAEMSEGTRDQLFLALRLAYLEDFARRAEPAPFVGDDVFASFDDERTGHGLEALAAIGESVQPILFTHHGSVARIAEARLGGSVDIVAL
ncbi:ATP-binding protein [Enterovirga rhinocerotis]|uniref:Uncharacterized protein YhaN n=1 Tax=Enterovirga rhinocerotis TaxID=1339210 RepID=A0A4R7C044_9HYPH|nr:YhaN family protein [Enterovirga rhinocerotis]TDR89837.1 uncharacterized protein YhaN [Enterovirga rhinocerotis]